jgi:hypothetical protein
MSFVSIQVTSNDEIRHSPLAGSEFFVYRPEAKMHGWFVD